MFMNRSNMLIIALCGFLSFGAVHTAWYSPLLNLGKRVVASVANHKVAAVATLAAIPVLLACRVAYNKLLDYKIDYKLEERINCCINCRKQEIITGRLRDEKRSDRDESAIIPAGGGGSATVLVRLNPTIQVNEAGPAEPMKMLRNGAVVKAMIAVMYYNKETCAYESRPSREKVFILAP
jgi:hypothetical protein